MARKKKKLNKKFVIAISAVAVVLEGAFIFVKVLPKYFPQIGWMWRGTPKQHAEQGKVLYDQGKYEEAGEKYKRAIQLRGGAPDAEIYTALGDCYAHLVGK